MIHNFLAKKHKTIPQQSYMHLFSDHNIIIISLNIFYRSTQLWEQFIKWSAISFSCWQLILMHEPGCTAVVQCVWEQKVQLLTVCPYISQAMPFKTCSAAELPSTSDTPTAKFITQITSKDLYPITSKLILKAHKQL